MSILRRSFVRPQAKSVHVPDFAEDFLFVQPSASDVVVREEAAEMHVIVDRMQSGLTPATRVAEYSDMLVSGTDAEKTIQLLNNPPKQILDPTDVPDPSEFTEPEVSEQSADEANTTV